jgi:DNA-binding transcriptional ArsR family regulator
MEKNGAIGALAALAQETRLDIFRLLVEAGPAGMPAGRIGDRLGVPSATLSFHLKELRNAGIVGCRRNGRSMIYAADFGAMNALVGYLMENCCRGAAQPISAESHAAGRDSEEVPRNTG